MPYRYYHGRSGIIFNVNKRAVGVEVTKVVGNRVLRKRIHLRIEHVRRSRCNENFLSRENSLHFRNYIFYQGQDRGQQEL